MDVASLLTRLVAWLFTFAIHSSLLLGAAWLFSRLRPNAPPRLTERIWKLAAVGALVTATLQHARFDDPALGALTMRDDVFARFGRAERGELATNAPHVDDAALTESDPQHRARHEAASEPEPARHALPGATVSAAIEAREQALERAEIGLPFLISAPLRLALDSLERANPREPVPATRDAGSSGLHLALTREPGTADVPALEPPAAWTRGLLRGWSWRQVLLAGWLALTLCGALLLACAWTVFSWRLHRRSPLTSGPLRSRLDDLIARAGTGVHVHLSVSDTIDAPLTLGLLRREICVPRRVLSMLSGEEQEALLAHELAHALRRDPAWFLFIAVLERVFVFQPLLRLARTRIQEASELLCDDFAVRLTGDRLALASCLERVARWILGRRADHGFAPAMATVPSRLSERITRLLDDRSSPEPETRLTVASAIGLAIVGGVAAGAPMVSAARPTAPGSEPAAATAPVLGPGERALRWAPELDPASTSELMRSDPAPAPPLDPFALDFLDADLAHLSEQWSSLKQELHELEHSSRFDARIAELEARLQSLRGRRERLRALVPQVLEILSTHADGTPGSAAPSPTETSSR